MGRYVIKAARDRDAYFWWSTIVDAPVFLGTRAEVHEVLDRPVRGQRWPDEGEVEADLARADETGTSQRYTIGGYPCDGAWDDELMIQNYVTVSGHVPRERMGELYDLFQAAWPKDSATPEEAQAKFRAMKVDTDGLVRPFDD